MEKILKIVNRADSGFNASFWSEQSSEERIKALEHLRNQQLTVNGIRQRLQRICRVVERKQG